MDHIDASKPTDNVLDMSVFFPENLSAPCEELISYAPSPKFMRDKAGNAIEWRLRYLTSDEEPDLRKRCHKKVPVTGRRGQFTEDFDGTKYVMLVALECTVFPDLKDVKLQDKYGVKGEEELIRKLLWRSGDLLRYMNYVSEMNGLDLSLEEVVEDEKN
ncbi:phage portal protein [Eubacteriales bacterium OttesenSCG-928-A19]|nr:phage portal protein [Eubacteriales bacterium OttesenSCG-928-A19]